MSLPGTQPACSANAASSRPPTLVELVPSASVWRQVVAPVLLGSLLLMAGHWVARADFSLAHLASQLNSAARWLYSMNAGSVMFVAALTIACFENRVQSVVNKLGWREGRLALLEMPWSRIEAIGPVMRNHVTSVRRVALGAALFLTLVLLGSALAMALRDSTGHTTQSWVLFPVTLLPAWAVAAMAALHCQDTIGLIERYAGDAQLVCPTQRDSLSAQILAAHAAGHFDTPEAQAAFEAWQLRRKPD